MSDYISEDDLFKVDDNSYIPEDELFGEKPKRTLGNVISDTGVSVAKGLADAGAAIVGIADIPTGGRAGQAMDAIGMNPKVAQDYYAQKYSPAQQEANRAVEQAEGFIPKAKAMLQYPSTIYHQGVETIPSMLAGGALGAGIKAGATRAIPSLVNRFAPKTVGVLAGAMGEGSIGAGGMAEQVREQNPNKDLSGKQALMSLGAGAGTAVFGAVGGRLAQKLGFADADTWMANAGVDAAVKKGGVKEVAKRIVGGGITESVFEEMPQSAQEQVWQNAATGRPLGEGVGESMAQGGLLGGIMGAGANLLPNRQPVAPPPPTGTLDKALRSSAMGTAVVEPTLGAVVGDAQNALAPLGDIDAESQAAKALAYNQARNNPVEVERQKQRAEFEQEYLKDREVPETSQPVQSATDQPVIQETPPNVDNAITEQQTETPPTPTIPEPENTAQTQIEGKGYKTVSGANKEIKRLGGTKDTYEVKEVDGRYYPVQKQAEPITTVEPEVSGNPPIPARNSSTAPAEYGTMRDKAGTSYAEAPVTGNLRESAGSTYTEAPVTGNIRDAAGTEYSNAPVTENLRNAAGTSGPEFVQPSDDDNDISPNNVGSDINPLIPKDGGSGEMVGQDNTPVIKSSDKNNGVQTPTPFTPSEQTVPTSEQVEASAEAPSVSTVTSPSKGEDSVVSADVFDGLNDEEKKELAKKSHSFWKGEPLKDVIEKAVASRDVYLKKENSQSVTALMTDPTTSYFLTDGKRRMKVPASAGKYYELLKRESPSPATIAPLSEQPKPASEPAADMGGGGKTLQHDPDNEFRYSETRVEVAEKKSSSGKILQNGYSGTVVRTMISSTGNTLVQVMPDGQDTTFRVPATEISVIELKDNKPQQETESGPLVADGNEIISITEPAKDETPAQENDRLETLDESAEDLLILPDAGNFQRYGTGTLIISNAAGKIQSTKRITPRQALDRAKAFLKKFVKQVPEFKKAPVFTVAKSDEKLVLRFTDSYQFDFRPEAFGIDKKALKVGQKIRLDLGKWTDAKEAGAFTNIALLGKDVDIRTDGETWTDGYMIVRSDAPGKDVRDVENMGNSLSKVFEILDNAPEVSEDVYKSYIDGSTTVVDIGGALIQQRFLDFIVKNTDGKKKTSFIVKDKVSPVGVKKDGVIVAAVGAYNPDDVNTSGESRVWRPKSTNKTPAIVDPLFADNPKPKGKTVKLSTTSTQASSPAQSLTPSQRRVVAKLETSGNNQYNESGKVSIHNPLGLEVDNERVEITRKLVEAFEGKPKITPWILRNNLIRKDKKGRVHMDGPPRSDFELAERISKIFNKEIIWVSIGEDRVEVNGVVSATGELSPYVFIDIRNEHPAHVVLGHELSHFLEVEHPEDFAALKEIVSPLIKNREGYVEGRARYQIAGVDIDNEIIGDLLGDSFNDPTFWNDVAASSPDKFRKIANTIRKWINWVLNKIAGLRGFESEKYVSDIKAARRALAQLIAKTRTEEGRKKLVQATKMNPRFSFAGPKANSTNLDRAKEMEQSGASKRDIWKDTGWWKLGKGDDASWKYEIDDSLSSVTMKDGLLSEVLDHPALFRDYPQLEKIRVRFEDMGADKRGSYDPKKRILRVNSNFSSADQRSSLQHEVQHFLQTEEGFSEGGNFEIGREAYSSKVKSQLDSINKKIIDSNAQLKGLSGSERDAHISMIKEMVKERDSLRDTYESLKSDMAPAHRGYMSLTGEAESRLVQYRLDLPPAKRKAIPPWVSLKQMLRKEGLLKDGQAVEDVLISRKSGGEMADEGSPAFKKWFGDSVVTVDGKAGSKPLVVYKGMFAYDPGSFVTDFKGNILKDERNKSTEIETIDRKTPFPSFFAGGKGVKIAGFFSSSPDVASRFAPKESGAVYPVYLNFRKPYIIDAKGKNAGVIQFDRTGGEFRDAIRSGKYDSVIIKNTKDEGDVYVALEPNQIKGKFNSNPTSDPRIMYSVAAAPFTGSVNSTIAQAQDYLKSKGMDEAAERVAEYLWDKDAAISRVQRTLGPQPIKRDYNTLRRLLGKRISDEISTFDREVLQPLLQHMADNKLKVADVEELGHAQHAPEANLQAKRVNARRYVDTMMQAMTDKEKAPYADRLIDIQDEFIMNSQTRNQKRDNTVALMDQIADLTIDTYEAQRAEIDGELASANTERETTLAKNKSKNLEKRYETAKYWEDVKDRLSGMTNEKAAEITRKWNGNTAIQQAVDTLHKINTDRLDMLHESGELNDDEYKAIKETFQHYVPLMRDGMESDKNPSGRAGLGPLAKPIKVRAGSTKTVVDIFSNTVDLYQAAIARKYKNEAGRALYELVKANPDESMWSIIEQEKIPYYDNEGNIRFYTDQKEAENEVYVKIDGVKYLISVPKDNKSMRRFMDALKREPAKLGPFLKASRYITRIMAALNTSLSPEFILTNFMRDIQTASIHLQTTDAAGMQRAVYKNIKGAVKGIYAAERGDESSDMSKWYRDFSKHGGKIAWMQDYDTVADLAKTIEKELEYKEGKHPNKMKLRKLGKFIEAMNTSVENGVRLATYKVLVENGTPKLLAAKAASNLTVDFTRHGTAGPMINSLWMFANAGIQGNVRLIKALANNRSVQKITGGIVAFGFAANIMGALVGGDDDDGEAYYDKLKRTNPSIFERNMIFMIPGTEGKYIKIPMPYGYNTFFVLGNEAAGALRGQSPVEAMSRVMSTLMSFLNPLSSATLLQTIMPTIGDPIAQVMENKAWHGGNLMPGENPFGIPLPDSERYFKSVNPVAKFIAQGLNTITGGDKYTPGIIDMSPETLEMMVETYGGSALKLVKDTASVPLAALSDDGLTWDKTPGIRKFVGSSPDFIDSTIYEENNKKVDVLKAKYTAADGAERSELRADPMFKMLPIHKATESQLRRLNKRLKMVEKAGNNESAKRIKEQMLAVKERYNTKYNSLMK